MPYWIPVIKMQILVKNARVFTMDATRSVLPAADVLIDGNLIKAVGQDACAMARSDARVIDGTGQLLMPGLINAHFHSPVNFLKGSLDSLPLELFMLYEVPAAPEAALSARAAYIRTMLGAAEMLKLGITAVQDDCFFLPHPRRLEIDAVMSAYRDSGMRATVALNQPNVPELDKFPFLEVLLPAELAEKLRAPAPMAADALLEHVKYFIDTWHGAEDGRLRAAVSCSAPQRVTPEYFRALDALSRAHDLPFYVHILETRLQRVLGQERFEGRSLVRYVSDLGLLSPRMNVIHAVWIDDADIALLAASGAHVAHNPVSNLRLGSGVMPFRRLRDAGVPICLGTDEAIADDAVDMWAVVKMAGLIHNIADPDYQRWPKAQEILDCLYLGAAGAMRQAGQLGRIEPGYQADVVLLDLDTLPFTPMNDLPRQLVYCDAGRAVHTTIVAGEIVVEKGRLLTIDEAALRAEARDIMAGMANARTVLNAEAAQWLPHYSTMYQETLKRDVGMNRWVGGVNRTT
jgi:5-methylthioadenosine/S-adenosylhomocysteine deaminase